MMQGLSQPDPTFPKQKSALTWQQKCLLFPHGPWKSRPHRSGEGTAWEKLQPTGWVGPNTPLRLTLKSKWWQLIPWRGWSLSVDHNSQVKFLYGSFRFYSELLFPQRFLNALSSNIYTSFLTIHRWQVKIVFTQRSSSVPFPVYYCCPYKYQLVISG